MRKILLGIFGGLLAVCANAAQVANLDYVHKLIAQKWDISVPIRADNPMQVANMKYLLTAIDVANEILNGEPTTNYGNGKFATLQVADTTATNQAVETLIKKEIEYEFYLTFYRVISPQFGINISAAGEFVIDWGDGTIETINKTNTTNTTYLHDYSTTGEYTIGIGGQATAYNTDTATPTISFPSDFVYDIVSIDGSLGAIFSTLPDGSQPRFNYTFFSVGVYTIPAELFTGISGAPVKNMFNGTFALSLLRTIPDGLFAGISGAPAEGMFSGTFMESVYLTSIPENLFGNISGPAQNEMFASMFDECTSLTGPSARINGKYLYEIWPNATSSQVDNMYYGVTRLSDYANIPSNWK